MFYSFSRASRMKNEKQISKSTHSRYTQSAICVRQGEIAHQTLAAGVVIESTDEAINGFDHAAVLRRNDLWSAERLELLGQFASQRDINPYVFQ
jgi:hypothetical protein